jgi:hypothetical protein
VQVEVGGAYTGSTDGNDLLIAEQGGGAAAGAGFITTGASSAGLFAADAGSRIFFAFNVRESQAGVFQGEVHYIFQHTVGGVLHTYQVDSTVSSSFGRNTATGQANVVATATLTDVTNRRAPVVIATNLTLQVQLTDAATDSIAFTLWNGSTLEFSNHWDGFDSVQDVLGFGILRVW